MVSTKIPIILEHNSVWIYLCIWYPFRILRSFMLDLNKRKIQGTPYCARQHILKDVLLSSSLQLQTEWKTNSKQYTDDLKISSPPHLMADLFCVSPCIVFMLFRVTWKMYFEFIQKKRLNQQITTRVLCFCPFHTPENNLVKIKTNQPKMLNYLNTIPFSMWKEFCECEYLLQECFFLPLKYKKILNWIPLKSQKYVPHSNHIYQQQALGLWFDPNHFPKLTKQVSILFVSKKQLDQNIYWCLRATKKYYKTVHSMEKCPIAELYAITAHKVAIDDVNKYNNFIKITRTKTLHHISYIQEYICGPTLSQLIQQELSGISYCNQPMSTNQKKLIKFLISFHALRSVHQLGLLALRHNNLCPENFKVDFCLNPNDIKVHVKLINLHSASHLVTKTVHSRFLQSNPWFRSPELAYNIAIETSPKKSQCSFKIMGRATDAWSTGLSLACFLFNKNIQFDCHDIQPLTFDIENNAWKMPPNEWVSQMRNSLLNSSSPLSTPNDFIQNLALIIYDHLVKPELYERNIQTVLERMTSLLQTDFCSSLL
jgi:hypothetical protein